MNWCMRIINWLILIALPIIVIAILVVGYLVFWPVEVIKPNTVPYRIKTPIVKQGGTLIYEVDACKFLAIDSTIYRSFVDGLMFTAPPAPNSITVGCKKTNVFLEVPKDLPIGIYHIELKIVYKVNPIHDVIYNFRTEDFQVVE